MTLNGFCLVPGCHDPERRTPPRGWRRVRDTLPDGVNSRQHKDGSVLCQRIIEIGSAGVPPAKGWYSRDYLPHCDSPGLIQMITFRLADALPEQVVKRIKLETPTDIARHRKIEEWLDAGHDQCVLRSPENAAIVEQSLCHFDGVHYFLLAWCIMPNHVHVLVETLNKRSLAGILHAWKSYSAKQINQQAGRTGTLWQREYFDRYIRDDRHLLAAIDYIHHNPVKAGLVAKPELWCFSSARYKYENGRRDAGAPGI